MRNVVLSFVICFGCGAKPSVKLAPTKAECADVSRSPKTSQQLQCSLQFLDPSETIFLPSDLYLVDLSIDRELTMQGTPANHRPQVVSRNVVSSKKFALENVDLESLTIALSGPVDLKDVTLKSNIARFTGASVRIEFVEWWAYGPQFGASLRLIQEEQTERGEVSIDVEDLWVLGLNLLNFDSAVSFKTGAMQMSDSSFDELLDISQRAPAAPFYVHHNSFRGPVTITGYEVFFERNCIADVIKVGTGAMNQNRKGECAGVGRPWCAGDMTDLPLVGGFDQNTALFGDFDGDGRTEVIRIGPKVWHLYDPDLRRWKKWKTEQTVPWTLGVGDFDGDGKDDVFQANGSEFRFSSQGNKPWKVLQVADVGFARQYLKLADVDGDGVTDVVRPGPGELIRVSKSGRGVFEDFALDPGLPLARWGGNLGKGFEWIRVIKKNLMAYSFLTRTDRSIGYFSPGDILETTSFARYEMGKVCTSSDRSTMYYGESAGGGASGSATGWRQFGEGDFDGDGVLEPVRRHCGIDDPCESGNFAFRIATYNVNHAGVRTTAELATQIKWLDADVVVLQEIDKNTERNPYDMSERIAGISKFPYSRFFKSNDYQGGEYGQMVLSKTPIENATIIKLPDHKNPKEWSEHYIAISFQTAGKSFVSTHLINRVWRTGLDLSETQQKQVDHLLKHVESISPDYVLGDFNSKPDSAWVAGILSAGYHDAWATMDGEGITFPDLGGSPRRIDYIFAKTKSICAHVPSLITSDHYPVIAGY